MPPRKSTGSADSDEAAHGKQPEVETGANVEDYLLPRSLTQRLAKGVLPPNTAIHKDALLAISKAATVFVSYLSSHANEETQKKTVTPQDVLSALSEIEFDSFRPRIEKELAAYTAAAAQKRKSKKDGKGSAVAKSTQGAPTGIAAGDGADESEPEAKRLKRDGMQEGGGASVKASMKNGVDDDETELEDGDEHNEEGREEDEEEEEEDEEEGHADEDATQLEDELEAADSDTTRRRRNPDMDSDLDSDSD